MNASSDRGTREIALTEALKIAPATYVDANPRSAKRYQEGLTTMPGSNTRTALHFSPFPLTFIRGEEATLWSADGDRYTDFLGDFSAGLFGHSNPVIKCALKSAIDAGMSFGGTISRKADSPRSWSTAIPTSSESDSPTQEPRPICLPFRPRSR